MISKIGKKQAVILLVFTAVLFITLCTGLGLGKSVPKTQVSVDTEFNRESFEKSLESILSDIHGVRYANVLLSYSGGVKYIYAEDISETSSADRKTLSRDTVIAGGEAVRVGTENPVVSGAVVVYTGTKSASVRLDLLSAVESATGLSSDKITVLYGG